MDAAVIHVGACSCRVADYEWRYVEAHREAINRHWTEAVAANPAFFDGVVLLTAACRFLPSSAQPSSLELTLFKTRFRNFLYWRHHGFGGQGVIDAFGAAIVRASDGAILLVRQRPGNVNEGPYNFPCGFIDPSDIDASRCVDLAGNISREVAEEVGLGEADLMRCPGFLSSPAWVCIWRSASNIEAACIPKRWLLGLELISTPTKIRKSPKRFSCVRLSS